ncbi:MAG: hypothetical protein IT364_00310, partial [Candidatus Hydrogenedentes bacterium]|nr:hypothetical protein [Candidatus Hydrogenedentota bacterium]
MSTEFAEVSAKVEVAKCLPRGGDGRTLKKTTKRVLTKRAVMWLGQTCNLRCYFCYFLNRIDDAHHPE